MAPPGRNACTNAPELLILQIGRFLHTDKGIRKIRQSFQIQRHIEVPTFVDHAGSIEQTSYMLCGGVLRIGKVVTAGHYQAFYFSGDEDDLWPLNLVHDDSQKAAKGTDATLLSSCLQAQ